MDAVGFPDEETVGVGKNKVVVRVFPAVLIKTAKVRSDREKDHDDVRRMYERGLIDPDEIVGTLQHYREPRDGRPRGHFSPRKRLNDILAGRVPL